MANKDSLFNSVLENSVNTGLKTNLNRAITNAGVKIPADTCMWEYPEIIRKNLVAKTITGINILGKDVINVDTTSDGEVLTYNISTLFDTYGIDRPNYAKENKKWGTNLTVETVFKDLYTNVLSEVRGVYSGDMTTTDIDGTDLNEWENTLFNKTGLKTGLEPTTRYIRLYLTCQAEPIFINIGNLVKEITNGYNVKSSDTVQFNINTDEGTLSAHINIIDNTQLVELGIMTDEIKDPEENPELPDE
jgi:hypothetical protein